MTTKHEGHEGPTPVKPLADAVAADHQQFTDAVAEVKRVEAAILDKVQAELRGALGALLTNTGTLGAVVEVAKNPKLGTLWLMGDACWFAGALPVESTGRRYTTSLAVLYAGWPLGDIVEGLCARLEEQVRGGKVKAIERTKQRAQRLRAISEVLKLVP